MTRERDAPTLHPKVGGLGPQRRQKPQDSSGNGGLACHSGNGDGGQKEWGVSMVAHAGGTHCSE